MAYDGHMTTSSWLLVATIIRLVLALYFFMSAFLSTFFSSSSSSLSLSLSFSLSLSLSLSPQLLVWSPSSAVPLQRYSDHSAAIKALTWSPHQHGILASGGGTADKTIRFWNTLTGQPLQSIDTGSQVSGEKIKLKNLQ